MTVPGGETESVEDPKQRVLGSHAFKLDPLGVVT
jgi:hypothetical protein